MIHDLDLLNILFGILSCASGCFFGADVFEFLFPVAEQRYIHGKMVCHFLYGVVEPLSLNWMSFLRFAMMGMEQFAF